MPSIRENSLSPVLTPVDYDIAGNKLRAFFDTRHKLVFVIDYTINDRKPNVLLVINPVGDRKWDDILVNDYAVDLETVRPKKDNKYQKLDIEYSGLGVYADLIARFDMGDDIASEINELNEFRIASARRAASERLAAATHVADNARETIAKTNETIAELGGRIKTLRAKLSRQRKDVGREPTKQSAAKILRTEAQIDAANEKMRRAKKRLDSAQRRMVAADEDAEIAREILSMVPVAQIGMDAAAPALAGPDSFPGAPDTELVAVRDMPPAQIVPQFTEMVPFENDKTTDLTTLTPSTEAENMADEEVKPLFDKDPEILDEEIAFKPIEFDAPAIESVPGENVRRNDEYADTGVVSPLSFVPPTAAQPVENTSGPINVAPVNPNPTPVLDTITAVEMPGETETIISQIPIAPSVQPGADASVNPAPAPMPEIAPAPMTSDLRPVSPITGGNVPSAPARQKPTAIYYIMLVLLIVLSIFTLWIYQKSASDNIPDLATTAAPAEKTAPVQTENADDTSKSSPFITPDNALVQAAQIAPTEMVDTSVAETIVEEPAPDAEPVPEPVPEKSEPVPVKPEPEPVVEPEPVDVPAEPAAVDVVLEPEPVPVPVETPFLSEPVPEPEPIVNKPAYNVSQQENMFVASPDYETDVQYSENINYDNDAPMCSDGGAPDANGCCAGEEFTDMGGGTVACCNGDECFPPMF